MTKIWECKIGGEISKELPVGADEPMRRAMVLAYCELTGQQPRFVFSGWGGKLTKAEQEVVEEWS